MTNQPKTLTENAARLICAILLTEYQSGQPVLEIADWADVACDSFDTPQQGAGTISRAVAAGHVWHCDDDPGSETVGITPQGWANFQTMYGECDENDQDSFQTLARRALKEIAQR